MRRHLPSLAAAAAIAGALLVAAAPAGAAGLPDKLSVVAGTGTTGVPTAGPATASKFGMVFRAAAAPDGTLFLPDTTNRVIAKVTPEGDLSIVAGEAGFSGTPTEGPATASRISAILGSATDRQGNLYVYDSGARRILKIDTAGQLTFVAGTGVGAMPGTPLGADARSTQIATGGALAVDPAGNVFFADTTRSQILKITPSGGISAVAGLGGGADGAFVEGPALSSPMDPLGLAVAPDGSLYIANRLDRRIAKVDPGGDLRYFAGDGTSDPLEEGPRLSSSAHQPTNLQLEDDGELLFTDSQGGWIAKVTTGGDIVKVAGAPGSGGGAPFTGDDPFGVTMANFSLAATGDGRFFLSGPGGMVARVGRPEPTAPVGLRVQNGVDEATIRFETPLDFGSAPVTAYEVSTDDGVSWTPLTVTDDGGRKRSATVPLAGGGLYPVRVRVANVYGTSPASAAAQAAPTLPPPADVSSPAEEQPAKPAVPTSALPTPASSPAPAAVVPATPTPAGSSCRATRTVRVTWTVPRRARVARQQVTINGRVTNVARGTRAISVTLDPTVTREHTVRIAARTASGQLLESVRTYRLCTAARRGALKTTMLR